MPRRHFKPITAAPFANGHRYEHDGRTYEVTGWTQRRAGLVEVVIAKSPRGDWPIGTKLLASVHAISTARVA